jgi:hypothetical protein
LGNQEENRMGGLGEGKDGRAGRKSRHEVPELGTVQSFTATISPTPDFPAFGADAGVPTTIDVLPFGIAAATTSTYAYPVTISLCTFVAEPTHPPSSVL